MLFNSGEYLLFLPIVLALYYGLPTAMRRWLLLASSYVFYGFWDIRFLALIAFSTLVDYACGLGMRSADERARKRLVTISLVSNLGILGTFKYFDFFVDSLRGALDVAGLHVLDSVALDLILPVGISFYTFQTLGYTIDVYRRDIEPCDRLVDFAVFVAYFPQLVAGPIERAAHLLPQLSAPRRPDLASIRSGLTLLLIGFFKKVVVSDALIRGHTERAFADPAAHDGPTLLLGACLFSIQIYADFSGYTDIARGTSRLMGIELMRNFERPYLSADITEFWRRWHISLSSWLRDYLYIPLGGNRRGRRRTYLNLTLTMLLGGLWHGANWTFVVWGGLHGAALAAHRYLTREFGAGAGSRVRPRGRAHVILGCLATNAFVLLTWVFFRSPDLPTAVTYLAGLADVFRDASSLAVSACVIALYFGLVWLLDFGSRAHERHAFIEFWPEWARVVTYAVLTLAIWTAWPASDQPFIYFQF